MKNKVFFLLTLFVCLFSACGPHGNVTPSVQGLSFTYNELTLAVGESVRLSCNVTPDGATAELAWKSSNEDVLTVDRYGNVTAVATGRAQVTASCEGIEATCSIVVKTYLETIRFTGAAIVGDPDTLFFGSPLMEAKMGGQVVYVYKSLLTLRLLSEGLYLDEDGAMTGLHRGAVITIQTPIWYGPKHYNGGKAVGDVYTDYKVANPYKNDMNTIEPGGVNTADFFTAMDAYCKAYSVMNDEACAAALKEASASFYGARLSLVHYDEASSGYVFTDMPEALVTSGNLTLSRQGKTNHMCGLKNLKMTVRPLDNEHCQWGALVVPQDGMFVLADSTMYYLPEITYTYTE